MALSTGTYSDAVGAFYLPSGTFVGYIKELGYPLGEMGERNITNHANPAVTERVPNGLTTWADFSLVLYQTPGVYTTLNNFRKNQTVQTGYVTDEIGGIVGPMWVKSVEKSTGDAQSPDSAMLTVIITPRGDLDVTGGM
jgi:hypothetical protein